MSLSGSEALEMMGPSVEWVKVKERIMLKPKEASVCPLPCPPLQFGESSLIVMKCISIFRCSPILFRFFCENLQSFGERSSTCTSTCG